MFYLKKLSLFNWATFKQEEISFSPQFNAIIGETGSGKSLILDALQFIHGQRTNKKIIRKGAPFARVEAVFHCSEPTILTYLDGLGYPAENEEVLIQRVIYPSAPSKSFLNYSSVNAQTLVDFSQSFVDFVGQFEGQKLLQSEYQLTLLDEFAHLNPELADYQTLYQEFKKLQAQLNQLELENKNRSVKLEFLSYQIEEIAKLAPTEAEELKLHSEKEAFLRHKDRQEVLGTALAFLVENEANASSLVKETIKVLQRNSAKGPLEIEAIEQLQSAHALIENIGFNLSQDLHRNPCEEGIEVVLEKINLYQKLKKKFNKTVPEIVSYYEELLAERDELENFQQNQESLILSLSQAQATLNEKAQGLHQARLKAAALLSEKLTLYVQRLKMEEAQISVMVTKIEQLRENGCSDVSVHAEMNPGEGMHCLKDIASGGELSRVLLACRQVMATNDFISIFFFDEIDTGLGGETALSIGKALAEVAVNSQVIAITHLPQLAIYAQKLVEVSKERREMAQETSEADDELLLAKRTFSHIKEYSGSETKRVVEKMTPLF